MDEWETLTSLYRPAEAAAIARPFAGEISPEELDFYVAIRQCTESARKGAAGV